MVERDSHDSPFWQTLGAREVRWLQVVQSILQQFESDRMLGMMGPTNLTWRKEGPTEHVAFDLAKFGFDPDALREMNFVPWHPGGAGDSVHPLLSLRCFFEWRVFGCPSRWHSEFSKDHTSFWTQGLQFRGGQMPPRSKGWLQKFRRKLFREMPHAGWSLVFRQPIEDLSEKPTLETLEALYLRPNRDCRGGSFCVGLGCGAGVGQRLPHPDKFNQPSLVLPRFEVWSLLKPPGQAGNELPPAAAWTIIAGSFYWIRAGLTWEEQILPMIPRLLDTWNRTRTGRRRTGFPCPGASLGIRSGRSVLVLHPVSCPFRALSPKRARTPWVHTTRAAMRVDVPPPWAWSA